MSDRNELIGDAFVQLTSQGFLPTSRVDRMAVAAVVLDTVEDAIRADERQRILADPPEGDPSYGWHLTYMEDQLAFAEKAAARLVEVIAEQQERNDLLLDALEDVVNQACSDPSGSRELDSMALSAYAYGLRTLAERGRVTITAEAGRRVIAEWTQKP